MTTLSVLLVADDARAVELVRGALAPWNDEVTVLDDASVAMRFDDHVDAALIDLDVEAGAGLALVHFFRSRDPGLPIIALVGPGDLENDMVAFSLGVNRTLPKPLTGDALLVALSSVREKKAQRAAAAARRSTVPLTGVLDARDARSLAHALARTAGELTGGGVRVVLEDAREGELVGLAGEGAPDEPIVLAAYDESIGTLHVARDAPRLVDDPGSRTRRELEQLAHTAAAIGVLLRRLDAVASVGIKDPETSAYTFAYFVDVAGREIERARRYDRRFGLLTFLVENYTELRTSASAEALRETRRELVDTILDAVRDSDALAHVEDDEFYLLLPETGMLGALTCRRRIAERHGRRAELARLEGRPAATLTIGISTFPRDGRDLASLLRAAHQRGAAARGSAAVNMLRAVTGGLEGMLGALLRFRPDEQAWQIRQTAVPGEIIAAMAGAVAREATRGATQSDGVMYLVGDRAHPLVRGAYESLRLSAGGGAPAYWLRPRAPDGSSETSSQGVRMMPVEIEIDGGRVGPFVLLVVLTEAWTYACVASGRDGQYTRVMHTCDLEIVEALVAELQTTFHLQRGLE